MSPASHRIVYFSSTTSRFKYLVYSFDRKLIRPQDVLCEIDFINITYNVNYKLSDGMFGIVGHGSDVTVQCL